MMTKPYTILAYDPGLSTGFAIVRVTGKVPHVLDAGVLWPRRSGPDGLADAAGRHMRYALPHCDSVAWESAIRSNKIPTMGEVEMVRGVLLLRCQDAHKPYAVDEDGFTGYHPETVKATIKKAQMVECKGHLTKVQVREAVKPLARISWPVPVDHVSDAIAVALTHAWKAFDWRPAGYCERVKELVPRDSALMVALGERFGR